MAGAAEFAPEEYQHLLQEFSQLEKLHREHEDEAVNKRLPLFAAQAETLVELARQNIKESETPILPPAATVPEITPLPPPVTKREVPRPRASYTVNDGDLLWSIAKRPDVYGDPLLWPLLYQANRDQIKDPRKIYAGQTLSIPRNITEEERENARNLAKKSDIFSLE